MVNFSQKIFFKIFKVVNIYLKQQKEMWSVGYFVSTVGINEKIIRNYIQNQEKQDRGQAQLVLGL